MAIGPQEAGIEWPRSSVLVVADSAYGNTWTLAGAIADAFGNRARALRPQHVQPDDMHGVQLLIVGSPTQGGRPLPVVMDWLRSLPSGALTGVAVAAFDTRISAADQNFALRLLMRLIGYAAPRLAKELQAHGGRLTVPPEGYFVESRVGPLKPGEIERADAWARSLLSAGGR